jgi:hypothetical protein
MISIEGFHPTKESRNEGLEREKEPSQSPESQIEVNKNLLDEYSKMIEDFIKSQTEGMLPGAESIIKRSSVNMNVSQELFDSSAKEFGLYEKLREIEEEATNLANNTKNRISEVIAETSPEYRQELENSSWQEALETEIGKTYLAAIRGIIDGKQYTTVAGGYNVAYTMREFVRRYPNEAKQLNEIYKREFGKPHSEIEEAFREVEEMRQNPPQTPPEDPKYTGLASWIREDPRYKAILEELIEEHKRRLFGGRDPADIPLEEFARLLNTESNLRFASEKYDIAERRFRERFPELAALYDERERTKIHRDPDGMPNLDLDPTFRKLMEPDKRGVGLSYDEALRQLAIRYPEKAKGYAERYPKLREIMEEIRREQSLREEEQSYESISLESVPEIKTEEEIIDGLVGQIEKTNFDESILQERQKSLEERPVIDTNDFRDATTGVEERGIFMWADVDKIVGRPFANVNPGGWGFEYRGRKGRIIEIAKKILEAVKNPFNAELIFHFRSPSQRIKLVSIKGPSGPMYIVEDGSHRVAGAMLAGLRRIPAEVKRIKYPLEVTTPEEGIAKDWQKKIELGLIQGKTEEIQVEGRKLYKITVEREVLPWIRTVDPHVLTKISRLYEKLYPGSLNNFPIPRDALVDPIVYNYYMAGRWKEWEEKFSKNPRDKDSIVIYYGH